MKKEIKKRVLELVWIVVFCFIAGMTIHFGSNVAKSIWPSPAIQLELNGERLGDDAE